MKTMLSTIWTLVYFPLSIIGALTLVEFYREISVSDADRLYDALQMQSSVEAFGFSGDGDGDGGGSAELWLKNGGFVNFSYSTSRDVENVSEQGLVFQIGEYALECAYEHGDGFLRFDHLGDALGLAGEFPLTRVFNDYDSILDAASRLPDDASRGPNGSGMNCWKEVAPVHEFYMYPAVNLKWDGGVVFWRKATPYCRKFLAFRLCDSSR